MGTHVEMRAFFDAMASSWKEEVHPGKVRTILLQAGIRPGDTVLDVGSGTGVLLPFILEAVGPKGRVFALDISPAMLERSKAKGFRQVEYICAPVESIPLEDSTCHAVLCYSAFPHFADKKIALQEMTRVLVPGGHLIIAHHQSREELNEFHRHMTGPVKDDYLPDDHTMRMLAGSAGLVDVQITDGPSGYTLSAVKPAK